MKPMRMQKGTHQHASELNKADHPQQSTQSTHSDENKQLYSSLGVKVDISCQNSQ
jgi:hypothetical protein